MYKVLTTEMIKLKRSRAIMLAIIVSFAPAPIKFLQQMVNEGHKTVDWRWFLAEHQELMTFGMLTAIILLTCFVFGMEYQYKTISYNFTSCTPKDKIFIAKIITLLIVIAILYGISVVSYLLFGYLAIGKWIAAGLLSKYLGISVCGILVYFSLTTVITLINIVSKRYILSAVLILSYIMLIFPFHLKNNLFICPFMIPTAISATTFKTSNYILSNYYKGVSVNYLLVAIVMLSIFTVPLFVGMDYYRKTDVV